MDINSLNMPAFNTNIKSPLDNVNKFKSPTGGNSQGGGLVDYSMIEDDPELKSDFNMLTEQGNAINRGDGPDSVVKTFSSALNKSISDVNQLQKASESATETFATGGNIDIHSVMIASQKASLSLNLALQLRNKLVQAYQEVSRIQV